MALLILPSLALLVALTISALLIVIVPVSLHLTSSGTFSAADRTVYITFVTILATLLTAFLASQAQALFLVSLDSDLARWDPRLPLDKLDARFRTVFSTGSLRQRARNGEVVVGYLVIGLVTTAIVAGFSPSAGTREILYRPRVPRGPSRVSMGVGFGDSPGLCGMVESAGRASGQDYNWALGNGSEYYLPASMAGCPTRLAVTLAGYINPVSPDAFAYADGGVAVHRSAIGAPFGIYSPEGNAAPELNALLDTYSSSVAKTTQCIPVMKNNPISCRPGGTLALQSGWFNVTSTDELCSISKSLPARDPSTYNTMVKTMCAHHLVGQGTIVMAASGNYAHWLAMAIGDMDHLPPLASSSAYAVSCTVDTRNVWEYRSVTLSFQNAAADNMTLSRYARVLESRAVCRPPENTPALDEALYATTAAGNWQLLMQNEGADGWFDSIDQAVGGGRGPPYAFTDSDNALEDVLGLTAALVGSRINSSVQQQVDGTVLIAAMRVGTGKGPAVLYVLPPLATTILLVYLIYTTWGFEEPAYSVTALGSLIEFGKSLRVDSVGPRDLPVRYAPAARAGYVPHF